MGEEATCVPPKTAGNVLLAFGLVTAAGLSTTIGAALAFVMPYTRSSKNLFLAASLAIAAGVMVYVSFVEIFVGKALMEFTLCYEDKFAYLYATLCFFGGVLLTGLFDKALHVAQNFVTQHRQKSSQGDGGQETSDSEEPSAEKDLEAARAVGAENAGRGEETSPPADEPLQIQDSEDHFGGNMIASLYDQGHDSAALIRMGIFAGLALGFHDPSVGASVAIAIGIHNIPEGVCVAMPIYYATGSRWRAFMWATLSGMTELVGALLGWVVLRNVITPVVYGILFGLVAGMMVYISLKELLPTAHRYDPDDQVTSIGAVGGMVVMALSLVLFKF